MPAIELLTLLIERYEQARFPIQQITKHNNIKYNPTIPKTEHKPEAVVRFLIERQGLTQRDLVPQFGSESAVSMFLAGERNLTLEQVRKLSARFRLPADVFVGEAPRKRGASDSRRTRRHSTPGRRPRKRG